MQSLFGQAYIKYVLYKKEFHHHVMDTEYV